MSVLRLAPCNSIARRDEHETLVQRVQGCAPIVPFSRRIGSPATRRHALQLAPPLQKQCFCSYLSTLRCEVASRCNRQ